MLKGWPGTPLSCVACGNLHVLYPCAAAYLQCAQCASANDCSNCNAMLCCLNQGSVDTPFEGGTFELAINVPEQYPLVPPSVRFRTKIFHPNVHFKVGSEVQE